MANEFPLFALCSMLTNSPMANELPLFAHQTLLNAGVNYIVADIE